MPIIVQMKERILVIMVFCHLELYSKMLAIIAQIKVRIFVIISNLFLCSWFLYSKMLSIIAQIKVKSVCHDFANYCIDYGKNIGDYWNFE